MLKKRYQIRKGALVFVENKDFKSVFHELIWRIQMKFRGFIIKKLND